MPASPYTDLDRPPLDVRRLRRALVTPDGPWTRLELVAETGSTNADVAAAAQAGDPEGLVIVAERQTSGRGRRGRSWESPARAGIATSVLLRPGAAVPGRGWPPASATGYGWLPLLAGVALVQTVHRLAELDATLKWPNDLLVPSGPRRPDGGADREAKCAGILAEAVPAAGSDGGGAPAIVLGIGLNVTVRSAELPVGRTGLPATSLLLAGAPATDRDPLLRSLLRGIGSWYGRWRAAGGDAEACGLREAYLAHCGTVGREVRVSLPDGSELAGTATTVDPDGRLVVRCADGDRRVSAGDVLHVR
nr:biotin--[acetyl-CoA-carboxylase] ligase [Micromonospora sp. DSM 115978]